MYDGLQEKYGWKPSDIDGIDIAFIFDQIVARTKATVKVGERNAYIDELW
jgi:hypothetical protein